MSAQPLVLANNKTPANVATDFLCVIKDIEACIENSNSQAATIENRGLFKSMFSSSRKDLVDISRSQNKINEMMLGLIQEVITLNAMSYSFLAAVISELENRCRNGWKDSNGQFQELSDTGRQFADRANDIFVKILDGSKSTQNKIEVNQQNIAELREKLQLKAQMVLKHNEEIDTIKGKLSDKAVQIQKNQQEISSIQSLLDVKAERLSLLDQLLEKKKQTLEQHDQAIHALIEELQENNRLDMVREQVIQDIRLQLDAFNQQLDKKNQTLENQDKAIQALTVKLQENDRLDMAREQVIEDIRLQLDTLNQRANQHKLFISGLAIAFVAMATVTTLNLLNVL